MMTAARPAALPIDPARIPAEIVDRPHWVCWDYEQREGKWTKPPLSPATGHRAASTDPATWTTFDHALTFARERRLPGVGFVVTGDDPYVGIDLDKCRDPLTGELQSWADQIITRLASYAEVSPTGTGVRVWVKSDAGGLLPGGLQGRRKGHVEIYSAGRYLTVTGQRLSTIPTIEERTEELAALCGELFGQAAPGAQDSTRVGTATFDDNEVLSRARDAANGAKFLRLWAGDTGDYGGDDSAADLALISILGFWTQDADQLDRLFRRSGLYREKWDRADYRGRTIDKALTAGEVYEPGRNGARARADKARSGSAALAGLNDATDRDEASTGHEANSIPAPTFPVEVLPLPVRAYVEAAAASLACPAEMIAVPMLGFAGAVIGNRLHLVLKNSYREYATLYLAVVAPPGSAKTPALNLAQWPLDALQGKAEQTYRHQKAAYQEALDCGEKPEKPRLRDYFSSNLTLEALVGMFERAPGVAIVRDEILGWVASMDQYRAGKGSDRQEYLSLWSSKTIKLDRKNADPVYRRYPVACVCGGVQPELVGDLHHAAQKRDGFIERLLPIVPDVAPMPWADETISPGRYTDALAVYQALDGLPPADLDEGVGNAVGIGVELCNEARRLYVEWFNQNQTIIAEAHGLAAGFYSKLPAHVARLALILHALWNPDNPRPMVSAERMQDAIELGEFFRAHIGRFLALLNAAIPARFGGLDARIVRIVRILRTTHAERGEGWASRSDLLRRLGNAKAADLSDALDRLQAAGVIESRSVETATKTIEEWRLVPDTERHPDSKYSNYSNYSGGVEGEHLPEHVMYPAQLAHRESLRGEQVAPAGMNGHAPPIPDWKTARRVPL